MKRQTMVEIFYPGSFFAEEESREVESRDIEKLDLPPGAFAFQFYDLITLSATREDGKVMEDFEEENRSPKYFPDGELFTEDQIKAMGPDFRILASNMRSNGWPQVVKTRRGNYQPFEPGKTEIVRMLAEA